MERTVCHQELLRRFPALAAGIVCPMRCTVEVGGRAKYIKRMRNEPPQYSEVALSAFPAYSLSVTLAHAWPEEVEAAEKALLDDAVLMGIAEGVLREEWTPWGCTIRSLEVGYSAGETTPVAARIAAAMAVRDMCRRPGWEGNDPGLPPSVA